MQRHQPASALRRAASGAARRGSTAESLGAVHQRLAETERELRTEFARIAQLQAQLDVIVGALRRSMDGIHV